MDTYICAFLFMNVIGILHVIKLECCRFGPYPNCGFPCRCTGNNTCDSETGECAAGSHCQNSAPVNYKRNGPGCIIGNIAYNKSNVHQLGRYPLNNTLNLYYDAHLAVDGDATPYITQNPKESCAHPFDITNNPGVYAWWWVNLGSLNKIINITIVNRLPGPNTAQPPDLFKARSTDYDIKIGNTSDRSQQTLCFHQNKNASSILNEETLICSNGDMVGRYVSFTRTGGTDPNEAAICEFIVMGYKVIECSPEQCNGNCDPVTGCDNCTAGKMLPDCKQDCPDGYWGVNCNNSCGMCKDGKVCDKETGSCGKQCSWWFIPDMCTEELRYPPNASNEMISQITSESATVSWKRSPGFDDNNTQFRHFFFKLILYTLNANDTPTESEKLKTTVPMGMNISFIYSLAGLLYNTEYKVIIVSQRKLNNMIEDGYNVTTNFKTLCEDPSNLQTPLVWGSPGMFTVSWKQIEIINSGCDNITAIEISIQCTNDTHMTVNETVDLHTTNTSFQYAANNSVSCSVVLIVTNNEGLSAASAPSNVPTIPVTTPLRLTTPTVSSSPLSTQKEVTSQVESSISQDADRLFATASGPNVDIIIGATVSGVITISIIIVVPLLVILWMRRKKEAQPKNSTARNDYEDVSTFTHTYDNNRNFEVIPTPDIVQTTTLYQNVGDYENVEEILRPATILSNTSPPIEPPRPAKSQSKVQKQQKALSKMTPKQEIKLELENTDTKIPLCELELYIRHKNENRGGFTNEYEALPANHIHPCTVALLPGNVDKNRFKNISAYDHSRVKLDILDDNPLSDYINANYISGHKGDNSYIAGQGPKPQHVNDFWRMIWVEQINRIVMVTNEVEAHKRKCSSYWPSTVDSKVEHGDIIIQATAIDVYTYFTIRAMRITKGNETRQIHQFHFTSWHDKRTPAYVFPLLIFRHKIRSFDACATGPLFVHCSAGVGRTGTFIAIDYLIDQAKTYHAVDVFTYVNKMRDNRVNMIQTVEQYIFVYDAILEAQTVGETAIPCSKMNVKLSQLIEEGEYMNISQLEKEFKVLQQFSPKQEQYDVTALSSDNLNKNRDQSIYPSDMCRPYLFKQSSTDTDYINAVYINGYTKTKAFIVTQLPLANTIADFWRMIIDHNSTTIIVLEQQTLPFLPTDRNIPQQYGKVDVTLISETCDRSITIQELVVKPSYGACEAIRVNTYHTTSWTHDDCPELSEMSHLLQLLEKRQRAMHPSPCTIQCLNGVYRSGVLISILYAIDRMRVDQEIDIFHAVKAVKINRKQFIETLVQYEYIYEVVQAYNGSEFNICT